ncbi:hypothetical protein RvY_02157 [Ramazzottius varieornatus]|nr:hypothetical protein RvY_02157 [Ramazzottius varieornatus]
MASPKLKTAAEVSKELMDSAISARAQRWYDVFKFPMLKDAVVQRSFLHEWKKSCLNYLRLAALSGFP